MPHPLLGVHIVAMPDLLFILLSAPSFTFNRSSFYSNKIIIDDEKKNWYETCVAIISPSPLPLLFFRPQAATGRWIPPNPSLYNYNRVVQDAASFLSSLVYVVSVCGCVWELSCVCDCVRPWLDALKEVKRYTREQEKASEMEFFKKNWKNGRKMPNEQRERWGNGKPF